MRIGFQLRHFDAARGGAETYAVRMAQLLLADGHTLHLFAASAVDVPEGATFHRVDPFTPERLRVASAGEELDVIVGGAESLGMNVFQPHGGAYRRSLIQNEARFLHPWARKVRAMVKWLSPKTRRFLRLEREQYRQTNPQPRFVAISKFVERDMRAFYGVPAERLDVVYNGVDTDDFSPARLAPLREAARKKWGLEPDATCFLLIAHNLRLKGTKEIVRALGRLVERAPKVKVLVAGNGNGGRYLRAAKRLGCERMIDFVGTVQPAHHAYAAADVLLLPTWYDPCSLSTLEAWACGLPVITTRFNGAAELMTPGVEGLLIDTPAETAALADAMLRMTDVARRRQMAIAARALGERCDMRKHYESMMAVYGRAAAERGGAVMTRERAGAVAT